VVGKDFIDWTSVADAKPLFQNHYQPHLPADLGFCDALSPRILSNTFCVSWMGQQA
jgi:hypothetical protein